MKGKVKWALSAQDKSCSPPLPTIECCFLSNWNRLCILIMTFFSMVQSLFSSVSFIIYILHFCHWIYIYHECTDPFTWRRWYWIFLLRTIVIITPGNSPEIKKLKRRNRDMSYFDLRQSPRCKKYQKKKPLYMYHISQYWPAAISSMYSSWNLTM